MSEAVLYLFPTPIADIEINQCLPEINSQLLLHCDDFVVEQVRTARRFLRKAGYNKDFENVNFYELNEHTDLKEIDSYLEPLRQGRNLGLMSEAGLPCVADPGAALVKLAQKQGFKVCPLIGPSSLLMSLMASGFNGQNFAFVGYLPIDKSQRIKKIKELETLCYKISQTQIFIEAPYRNNQMFQALKEVLSSNTMLCLGVDIGLSSQQIISKTISEWKKTSIDLNKRNTVFLIYK